MRLTVTTPAIVLRSWPYGESDKIVCLLTETHGKITGIAKGAKRSRIRFANSLEPFSFVNLRFQDRHNGGLVFILAAELTFAFKNLGNSLEKITLASYLVEITDGLTGDRDENSQIYLHLKNGLLLINRDGVPPSEFLPSFELELLRLAGYQPALDSCKRCSVNHRDTLRVRWHFSPAEGGIFCEHCVKPNKEIFPLGTATLAAMAKLQNHNLVEKVYGLADEPLPRTVLNEVRFITQRFLQFHIDREIKSATFLAKFVAV